MRHLIYNSPTKVISAFLTNVFYLNNPDRQHYERAVSIATKYGIVNAFEFNWANNFGKDYLTEFSTIYNGYRYSADLNEVGLTDRQFKWLATHFIKTVLTRYKELK